MKEPLQIIHEHSDAVILICAVSALNSAWHGAVKRGAPGSLSLFLLSLGVTILLALLQMGFWRAGYEGRRCSLIQLMKLGARFFWRLLGVGFLFFLAFFLPVVGALLVMRAVHVTSVLPMAAAAIGALLVSFVLFFRYAVLVPAVILVVDCGIGTAFSLIRLISLRLARNVWFVFVLLVLTAILIGVVRSVLPGGPVAVGVLRFVGEAITTFLQLLFVLEVMAHVVRGGFSDGSTDGIAAFAQAELRDRLGGPRPPTFGGAA